MFRIHKNLYNLIRQTEKAKEKIGPNMTFGNLQNWICKRPMNKEQMYPISW